MIQLVDCPVDAVADYLTAAMLLALAAILGLAVGFAARRVAGRSRRFLCAALCCGPALLFAVLWYAYADAGWPAHCPATPDPKLATLPSFFFVPILAWLIATPLAIRRPR